MPTFIDINDTVEGCAIDCNSRVFYDQGLKKHPVLAVTMKHYTSDRNSSAVVKEAGVEPNDEDIRKASDKYHRNVGDRIECDAMSIYTEKKSARIQVLHGSDCASSQHGVQFMSLNKHSTASVKMPLSNLMKKLGYSNNMITDTNKDKV